MCMCVCCSAVNMYSWVNIEKPKLINFSDIVSEEVLRNLKAKKENAILDTTVDGWTWIENCKELKCKEYNSNEVSVLCGNIFQETSLNNDSETGPEKEGIEAVGNDEHFDIFDHLENELTQNTEVLGDQKLQNSEAVINKHDIVLRQKKKNAKLSSLPFKFRTDDGKMIDFNSSYNYFKSLKIYFRKEECGTHKCLNKYPKGIFALDPHSHWFIYKMIASRLVKSVDCVINISSEAIILHGTLDPSYEHATQNWPKNCAIKVFKKVSKFQSPLSYQYKEGLIDETKTLQWWAQKEMDNLVPVWKAGVPCPQILQLKGHILAISFIGKDRKPAPKLKYAGLRRPDYVSAYKQVKNTMKMLYKNGNLIHGDMSEYNVLWQDGQCYFIDFSHSVNPSHEHGYYFLLRDCVNMTKYFKQYIPTIEMESGKELFECITGFRYGDKDMLHKMQKLYKENPHVYHKPPVGEMHFEDPYIH